LLCAQKTPHFGRAKFLHGEQGALAASARLVETVPGLDAKYHLASQVVDEARHLEVFSRYLRDNGPDPYPPSPSLITLLEHALADARWDVTALGMHIMIEALAMAAFRLADGTFHDALIRHVFADPLPVACRCASLRARKTGAVHRGAPTPRLTLGSELGWG
jgi:hypothetical protein